MRPHFKGFSDNQSAMYVLQGKVYKHSCTGSPYGSMLGANENQLHIYHFSRAEQSDVVADRPGLGTENSDTVWIRCKV